MNRTLVFIDTETGGLDPETHSLLTLALVVVKDNKIIDLREWFIKHETYNVSAEALKVNNINLTEFDSEALDKEVVGKEIIEFLSKYCSKEDKGMLVGQNTLFDKNFLESFFKGLKDTALIEEYRKLISHNIIDIISISAALNIAGVITTENLKLDSLIDYFNLEVTDRHTAFDDAVVTFNAFIKMMELIKGPNNQ